MLWKFYTPQKMFDPLVKPPRPKFNVSTVLVWGVHLKVWTAIALTTFVRLWRFFTLSQKNSSSFRWYKKKSDCTVGFQFNKSPNQKHAHAQHMTFAAIDLREGSCLFFTRIRKIIDQ